VNLNPIIANLTLFPCNMISFVNFYLKFLFYEKIGKISLHLSVHVICAISVELRRCRDRILNGESILIVRYLKFPLSENLRRRREDSLWKNLSTLST